MSESDSMDINVGVCFVCLHTVFLLIHAPGALQFMSVKSILETKMLAINTKF